eukprot:Gb_34738 [translate_table: standard]
MILSALWGPSLSTKSNRNTLSTSVCFCGDANVFVATGMGTSIVDTLHLPAAATIEEATALAVSLLAAVAEAGRPLCMPLRAKEPEEDGREESRLLVTAEMPEIEICGASEAGLAGTGGILKALASGSRFGPIPSTKSIRDLSTETSLHMKGFFLKLGKGGRPFPEDIFSWRL